MHKIRTFTGLIFVTVLSLLTGCNQDEICLSNQHAIQIGLYSAAWQADRDTTLAAGSVHGAGNPGDSIYRKENLSTLFLPLSFSKDTTAFIIDDEVRRDTLWIKHEKEMKYISRECGFTFNFSIDSIWASHVFIDSIAIAHPQVNYGENIENVKIYLFSY